MDSAGTHNISNAKSFANKIYPFLDRQSSEKVEDEVVDKEDGDQKANDNGDDNGDGNGNQNGNEEQEQEQVVEEKKADDVNDGNGNNPDFMKVVQKSFVKLRVPQQKNGYDCGMYVVEFTGHIASYLGGCLESKGKGNVEYPSVTDVSFAGKDVKFDSGYMVKMRQKWRGIIDEMHKSQEAEK